MVPFGKSGEKDRNLLVPNVPMSGVGVMGAYPPPIADRNSHLERQVRSQHP